MYEQMSSELEDSILTGTSIDTTGGAYWKAKMELGGNTYQEVIEAEAGTEVIGTDLTISDYDSTKESKFTKFSGDTFQQTYTGKNLFNKNATAIYSYGSVTVTPIETGVNVSGVTSGGFKLYDLGKMSDFIGKTVTFSTTTLSDIIRACRFLYCDADGSNRVNIGNEMGSGNTSVTVTIASGDYGEKRLAFRLYTGRPTGETSYSLDVNNMQIEESATATDYEPYVRRNSKSKSRLSTRHSSSNRRE